MNWIISIGILVLVLVGFVIYQTTGAGGFERMIVRSGVYPVLRPGGYEVVCFLDADSKSGGLSCLPLSVIGEKK